MPKLLIVNADDYGLSPGVSAGIRRAHQAGIVTSTTVMMNMPDARPGLSAAKLEAPGLGLGVHLVLTAGRPLLPPERLKSVLQADGRFPRVPDLIRRGPDLDLSEVHAEWRAQIESFIVALGRPPDHLDSHHHASYLTPGLFETMLNLAGEYGLPVRSPFAERTPMSEIVAGMPERMSSAISRFGPQLLARWGTRHPDAFFVDFYADDTRPEALQALFDRLPEGISELMCHPALVDDDLRRISSYVEARQRELEALCSPGVKEAIGARGIELVDYGVLKNG